MSKVVGNSLSWRGFSSIKKLVIFGDSYSSVTFTHNGFSESKHPTAQEPLGIEYPGVTYNEPDLPNWVGHLITKYCPSPRFNPSAEEQDQAYVDAPLLVYNYARGGDQVSGIARQVRRLFLPLVGTKPPWAPWSGDDTLFITSVGINDCACSDDHELRINLLMELQKELYNSGARNFLFFDVPPVDQAPAFAEKRLRYGLDLNPEGETTFQRWNHLLNEATEKFRDKHPDCTVLVYSLYRTFNVLLEDLDTYGFPSAHKHRSIGTVWMDHIHPTSRIHDLIAHFLSEFLNEVPVLENQSTTSSAVVNSPDT